jgi:hypothetical protein
MSKIPIVWIVSIPKPSAFPTSFGTGNLSFNRVNSVGQRKQWALVTALRASACPTLPLRLAVIGFEIIFALMDKTISRSPALPIPPKAFPEEQAAPVQYWRWGVVPLASAHRSNRDRAIFRRVAPEPPQTPTGGGCGPSHHHFGTI